MRLAIAKYFLDDEIPILRSPTQPEVRLTVATLLKKPTAYAPLMMSTAALTVVLIHVARFGVTHEPDEGTSAHLWQLLMFLQVPIIAAFIALWLPRAAKETAIVVALQIGAAFVAAAPVVMLGL